MSASSPPRELGVEVTGPRVLKPHLWTKGSILASYPSMKLLQTAMIQINRRKWTNMIHPTEASGSNDDTMFYATVGQHRVIPIQLRGCRTQRSNTRKRCARLFQLAKCLSPTCHTTRKNIRHFSSLGSVCDLHSRPSFSVAQFPHASGEMDCRMVL